MSDETDLIDLKHAVDRHEQAITEDAIQIAALKSEIETLREQLKADVEGLNRFSDFSGTLPTSNPLSVTMRLSRSWMRLLQICGKDIRA